MMPHVYTIPENEIAHSRNVSLRSSDIDPLDSHQATDTYDHVVVFPEPSTAAILRVSPISSVPLSVYIIQYDPEFAIFIWLLFIPERVCPELPDTVASAHLIDPVASMTMRTPRRRKTLSFRILSKTLIFLISSIVCIFKNYKSLFLL
jgi:hypothetical protein